jgi:uncharacterized protein (DUF1800 family)
MIRKTYTETPEAWDRASRHMSSPVDYASPITRYDVTSAGHRFVAALSVVGVAVLVFLLATGMMR